MHHERAEQASSLKPEALTTLLQALADPALTRLKVDDLSHAVLRCLREIMAADNLAILLLTEDHTALRIHTVLGIEETVARDVLIPLGRGFAGQIVTQGLPLIVHNGSPLEVLTPVLREHLCSLLGVPLIVHEQVIGVIHIGMKQKYLFTDADVVLLLRVADSLAQAFERTLLIEAEQHEFEELVEVQLYAVVKLVEAQLHMAQKLQVAQLHTASELVEAQQRVARELVKTQLHAAEGLMEKQLYTAEELVEAQLPLAEGLVEAQRCVAAELVKAQQYVAGELMEAQQQTAEELETQLPMVGESVEVQQRVAAELVEVQQQTAGELVEAQLPLAEGLVEAQQQTAGELQEAQLHVAGELVEAQQDTAGELVKAQLHVAGELVETQLYAAVELLKEQQRIGIEARERMNDLETMFNTIMDGVIVYNEHREILRSNRAVHRLLNLEMYPTELNADVHPSWKTTYQLRDAHGYPFSHEHLPLNRLLQGERLTAEQAVMVLLHTLDGRSVELSVTGAPFYDQVGQLSGAVCVLRDVTTRKHMERRIEILEVFLQMVKLLVQSSVQKEPGLIQDDPELVIHQIESTILALVQRLLGCSQVVIMGIHPSTQVLSPLALAGYSMEEEQRVRTDLTGTHLSLLITDTSKVALLEQQEDMPLLITQSPLFLPLSSMSSVPNGQLVPIYITHRLIGLLGIVFPERAPLLDAEGVALITAISKLCTLVLQYEQQTIERDQLMVAKTFLNEQLEQLNTLQRNIISVVSHEFRTPLTTIEGFSDLLRSEEYSSEEVKEYANDIYTDAMHLHRIVTQLLDLEQMKQGQMQLRKVWVDMNTLLITLAKQMELITTRHRLRLSLDEKLPQFEGDPEKLIQVMTNILSNATKYSPGGGDILIMSSREGNAVHVSVQDHGIGITSERIKNIFTPYHRTGSTSTRYIEGMGLGLSLVQEIIHLHGGKIWVESTLGHGSTFHFSLPFTLSLSNEEMKQC